MLADGEPIRSCVTTVAEAVGKKIVTIEGLPADHPVAKAWLAEEVPQCGYCQPGQMLAAASLLHKTPQPTDADINTAMGDLLCRCGTYPRIRRAIHRAAKEAGHGK